MGSKNIGVGDWVRFYQNGRLVIGQVEYVKIDELGYKTLQTDYGAVRENYVLEWRRRDD